MCFVDEKRADQGPLHRVRSSTPRTPADVELLFNLQFAAPAKPPPAHKANKLQKTLLEYRPTLEDSEGRPGSQEFTIDMPEGVRSLTSSPSLTVSSAEETLPFGYRFLRTSSSSAQACP